jgi:hypothetical protein
MSELEALAKEIHDAQKENIGLDYSRGDFYIALQERFATEKSRLDNLLNARKSTLATLERAVLTKYTNAFTSLECPAIDDPTEEIASAVEALNGIR